jgi:hypothetical protein
VPDVFGSVEFGAVSEVAFKVALQLLGIAADGTRDQGSFRDELTMARRGVRPLMREYANGCFSPDAAAVAVSGIVGGWLPVGMPLPLIQINRQPSCTF